MTSSIRLFLVGWTESFSDHLVEKIAKLLRGGEAHPQAAGRRRDGVVVGVDRCGRQPQIDNAIDGPSFTDQINEMNRRILSAQLPPLGSDGKLPAGLNDNLVLGHLVISSSGDRGSERIMAAGQDGVES